MIREILISVKKGAFGHGCCLVSTSLVVSDFSSHIINYLSYYNLVFLCIKIGN